MYETRRLALSIKQKVDIIHAVNRNESKKELCAKYMCNISTINRIIKSRKEILKRAESADLSRKRQRKGVHDKVEEALFLWFQEESLKNELYSRHILLKAKELAMKLKENFDPDATWLWRWRKRHNIKIGKNRGQSAMKTAPKVVNNSIRESITRSLSLSTDDVNVEVITNNNNNNNSNNNNIINNQLGILDYYSAENVFNAYETGLFYKALPSSAFLSGGGGGGGRKERLQKSQKVRYTLFLICNATGTYRRVFVIGKTKIPRCIEHIKIPLTYYTNKKVWMTLDLWNKIVTSIEAEMAQMNRKVVLFINSAPCYLADIKLMHIQMHFLKPNNADIAQQSLDKGIVHAFKLKYRQLLVRKQLCALEQGRTVEEFLKSISLLDSLMYIKRAWWLVKSETIFNCFRRAGFTGGTDSEPMIEMEEENHLYGNFLNWYEYVHCDDDITCHGVLANAEQQIALVNDLDCDLSSDESDCNEDLAYTVKNSKTSTMENVFHALDILERFSLAHNLEKIQNNLTVMEEEFLNFAKKQRKQTKMTDFYSII